MRMFWLLLLISCAHETPIHYQIEQIASDRRDGCSMVYYKGVADYDNWVCETIYMESRRELFELYNNEGRIR